MKAFLYDYVRAKIQPSLKTKNISQILVKGKYRRDLPAVTIAIEKESKAFNRHRPTAKEVRPGIFELNCFPGRDFVEHYASLLNHYLSMEEISGTVRYEIPSSSAALDIFLNSNLQELGSTDIVVLGYIEHLRFVSNAWNSRKGDTRAGDMFYWQKVKTAKGYSATFLGCLPSFWGDISGQLVQALQQLSQVKCVLYVGKTGSLHPQYPANESIATGDKSYLHGEVIEWDNVFKAHIRVSTKVSEGIHVTVSSPLCESMEWLGQWAPKCNWVDCEVGYMAAACNSGGCTFGYLHIVSDNLINQEPFNLSNERQEPVAQARKELFTHIDKVLQALFMQWAP